MAFQDPAVYGRSPLENSSFIASSRFPDPKVHGVGFVARLSGATAEWISMVLHMGLGATPFRVVDGTLRFEREVDLYLGNGVEVGPVEGVEPRRYPIAATEAG